MTSSRPTQQNKLISSRAVRVSNQATFRIIANVSSDELVLIIMRVYKLYLNVYNFTGLNCCLGPIGLGGYHTAIQINDDQYCFCVTSTDPDQTGVITIDPQTADYQFSHKMYLGEVEMLSYRFEQIMGELEQEYKVGTYHMFTNNCNHFSRSMAKKLLNIDLPGWIFRITDCLGAITCCLPASLTNGQWALQQLLQEQTKREEQAKLMDQMH